MTRSLKSSSVGSPGGRAVTPSERIAATFLPSSRFSASSGPRNPPISSPSRSQMSLSSGARWRKPPWPPRPSTGESPRSPASTSTSRGSPPSSGCRSRSPTHAQFIPRGSSDPRDETKALSATRARQLMGLPAGDSVFDFRNRAILKFFLYSGARIGTACRLKVKDFHQDGDEATITLHEKGDKHRRIGLHFNAGQAISEYIEKAKLTKGPLFRARRHWRLDELSEEPMSVVTMYDLIQGYLARLPGAMREEEVLAADGNTTKVSRCVYTPHSLRATTATLLLDAGVDIIKVKELLGHRHVTTTQIYDKRRRSL